MGVVIGINGEGQMRLTVTLDGDQELVRAAANAIVGIVELLEDGVAAATGRAAECSIRIGGPPGPAGAGAKVEDAQADGTPHSGHKAEARTPDSEGPA